MRDTLAEPVEADGRKNPELHFSLLDVQAGVPGVTGKIPAAIDVLRADEKQDGYLHYCNCVRVGFVARVSIYT